MIMTKINLKFFSHFKTFLRTNKKFDLEVVGLIFVLLQACGLGTPSSSWGLDPSWVWLTQRAAQKSLYGSNEFIWTNGPLSFLDYQQNFWALGLVMSTIFKIFSGALIYFALLSFLKKNTDTNSTLTVAIATSLTTLLYSFYTPSLVILASVFIYGLISPKLIGKKKNVEIICLALVCSFEFYTKTLQFFLACVISGTILLRTQQKKKFTSLFLSIFLLTSLILASIFRFRPSTFWLFLRGNIELTIGYKAMGFEQPARLLEYPAILLLLGILFFKVMKSELENTKKISIVVTNLMFFEYGFIRHDAHSVAAFTWVGLSLFLMSRIKHDVDQSWMKTTLTLSLIFFLVSSGYSSLTFLDFTSRLGESMSTARMLDRSFVASIQATDKEQLINNSIIPEQILKVVSKSSVAIYPYNQLAAKAYDLNIHQSPIPQLYSAYTPWLDSRNADFFSHGSKPKFILEEVPTAIDGRNPFWEAPKTQLSIFCNYEPAIQTEKWLLLTPRERVICDRNKIQSNPKKYVAIDSKIGEESVQLFSYSRRVNLPTQFMITIFKAFSNDVISSRSVNWRAVSKNSEDLILSVPRRYDYPGAWSFNQVSTISKKNNYHFEMSTLQILRGNS